MLLVNFSLIAQSSFPVSSLSKIPLKNLNGKISHLESNKALAFIFLSPECPLCQNYISEINALSIKYPEINFIGIIPGKAYSPKEILEFKRNYDVKVNLYIDEMKRLTSILKATTTPEVILLDRWGILKYRGLIDNWPESLGVKRKVVTEHYLNDALINFKNGRVTVKTTKPVGCLINDK